MTSPALRFPAEWEAQSAVLLTWPHAETDWAPNLAAAEATFATIARAVLARESLIVGVHHPDLVEAVRARIAPPTDQAARLQMTVAPSNDSWVRDHGPLTVFENGQAVLLDFTFNAWGGKYDSALDDAIPAALHRAGVFADTPLRRVDFVLEGGALESDGQGTLLTTTSCLLDPRRNAGITRATAEARLRAALGIERVLWLTQGHLEGDDTDGHIDTLARFADPETIVYQGCDDPADRHYTPLRAMAEELAALRQTDGRPYRLIALPLPRPIRDVDGRRLPATYANFLIINGAVLLPVYGDPADGMAQARLAEAFPERQIVPIDCSALIRQFGSLHCVTMQLPAAVAVTARPSAAL
jgi:agmatine/peptidylarginine deiminase